MNLILNIETSGNICSVSLSDNEHVLVVKENSDKNSHSSQLAVLVNELFATSGFSIQQLSAVAISKGPGSYTGLRISTSFAKGLCYSLSIPLIAIDTLKILAKQFILHHPIPIHSFICAMIDARRMEAYNALFTSQLEYVTETQPVVLTPDSFSEYQNKAIYFIGNGVTKWKQLVTGKWQPSYFIENCYPSSEAMAYLSALAFHDKQFENLAYFEPSYLKEFIAGTSQKNKLI